MANKHFQKGYTLLEISLTLTLLVFVLGLGAPMLWSAVTQNDLGLSVQIVTHSLRRAQSLSMAMQKDTRWGVKLTDKNAIVFAGNSFDSRLSDYDEIIDFPVNLKFQGSTELIFEKLSGLPNFAGNITLENPSNQTKTITISPSGTLDY